MKKIFQIAELITLTILLVIGISSCLREKEKTRQANAIANPSGLTEGERKIKKLYDNAGVYVFDVDGHQYIFNINGGAIHSESCPCKTNTY